MFNSLLFGDDETPSHHTINPRRKKETMPELIAQAFKAHRKKYGAVLTKKLVSIASRMEYEGHVRCVGWGATTVVEYRGNRYDLAKRFRI